MENKICIINLEFRLIFLEKMLTELFTLPWLILFFATILPHCFGQCNPGCPPPIPLPQPCQRPFPPPPPPIFPPIPSQNCQPFPQQPCVQRPPNPYPHLPQIPPPAPIGPYLTKPPGYQTNNPNHHQQQYQIYPPSSTFHQSTNQQYGFGGYGYGGGGRPFSPSPYYTGQYTSNVYPIPASEKLVPPSSPFGDIKSANMDDHKDPFEKEEANRKESSSVEEDKGHNKMAGGHQYDPSMFGGYRISPSPMPTESGYGIRPPFPTEGGYGIRPPNPAVPLPQLPVVYPTPQIGSGHNPCHRPQQPCGPMPCPPQPLPMPQLPCPPPPPMPLPQPCPPPLPPPPPMPLPCPMPLPPPLPLPPPPMPLPLPPIQNCCLQCGRPCLKAMMSAKKAMAVKSATKSGILERILRQGDADGEDGGIGKEIDEEFREQCNDLELAQILEKMKKMGMAEAKEKIRTLAEQSENQRAQNDVGKQAELVTTIFHVFCGPKPMEYAIRADRYCAGRVADGICFVFGTVRR